MYINNQYIRNGEIEIKNLFLLENLTKDVKKMQAELIENLEQLRKTAVSKKEPEMSLERKCIHCEYSEQCGIKLPKYNVYTLRGNGIRDDKKWELFEKGIVSYKQLLDSNYPLNKNQRLQAESEVKKLPPFINKAEIKRFLKTLSYPLYFLDFETYDTVIPEYDGMHPYMKVPFQFSLHILNKKNGKLQHREFLADVDTDPRRLLAGKLCEYIPDNACVLAYHMSFEKGIIKKLAGEFKDLSEHLLKINENMKDLEEPFRSKNYYSRAMEGSYSIKMVLPALLPPGDYPELDYRKLKGVKNGLEAMNLFPELKYFPKAKIEEYRKQLLKYCCLDTLAMVRIIEKLGAL
jgi:hypothetical protein